MTTIRRGQVEVHYKKNGTVDEVLIYDEKARVVMHLEQMDKGVYWMGAGTPEDDGYAHIVFTAAHSIRCVADFQNHHETDDPWPKRKKRVRL